MNYRLDKNKVLIVLEKGDEILDSIYKVTKNLDIKFGWINGIGAVENIIIGAYSTSIKNYIKKEFDGEFELISMLGNITIKKGDPFVHIHVTISDEECNAFGGHLFSANITATCEIMLQISNKPIHRKNCSEIGLYLWDFENGK